MLTKEAILAADDLPRVLALVPEWGGEVYVRALTGAELVPFGDAVAIEQEKDTKAIMPRLYPLLVALCACDESGASIFTLADAQELAGKHAGVVARVAQAALRVNKMHEDAQEELVGN